MIDVGDVCHGSVTFTALDGVTLVDPTTVVATITLPDGTTVTPTVTQGTTGQYSFDYPAVQVGRHLMSWVGSGAASGVYTEVFNVSAPDPGFLISLSEARKAIGFTAGDTVNDDDLRDYVASATPIMEDIIGSVLQRTRVETHDGGGSAIAVMYPPVLSITSVIESWGASFQRTLVAQNLFVAGSYDVYGYDFDPTTGLIFRRANGMSARFSPGVRNVQVTYIAGRPLRPNEIKAARRLVKFLWQSEQENYSPGAYSPDATATTPSGFEVPRIVLSLCADSQRPQGLA